MGPEGETSLTGAPPVEIVPCVFNDNLGMVLVVIRRKTGGQIWRLTSEIMFSGKVEVLLHMDRSARMDGVIWNTSLMTRGCSVLGVWYVAAVLNPSARFP